MRLLGAADIEGALPMRSAMQVMREALVAITDGMAPVAQRQALPLEAGTGLVMGAAAEGVGMIAKLVSVMPGNAGHGLPGTLGSALLADHETGRPLALLDGTALTAWRTAAVSACAIDALAREDARTGLLIGCGTQAATQLVALVTARRLRKVRVYALDQDHVQDFIGHYSPRMAAELEAVDSLDQAVAEADIILCITNSREPVFDAGQLTPGCHVSGIGSFSRDMCEIDPALAGRARVFVESRETAMAEAGELIAASESGLSNPTGWTPLGEVFAGRATGRDSADELTLFKSVGHALFDLYYARAVYDFAAAARMGTEWTP